MTKIRTEARPDAAAENGKAVVEAKKPPHRWKKGESGNPAGPKPGNRRKFSEEFISDVHESWMIYGKAALVTTAMTDPSVYVRVCASLMPRDIEVTITLARAERLSDNDLAGYLERPDSPDLIEAQASEEAL